VTATVEPERTPARRREEVPDWALNLRQPRDPRSGFLWPRHCERYVPGHTPHVIQVKLSWRESPRLGELLSVDANVIDVDLGNRVEQFRNHEPERLLEIVSIGKPVRVFSSILMGGTDYCWSIARAEVPWAPCENEPLRPRTQEALAERMVTHGGFLVPGDEVLHSGSSTK
jgi:hypothetical protein